jgi:hypothetical protein
MADGSRQVKGLRAASSPRVVGKDGTPEAARRMRRQSGRQENQLQNLAMEVNGFTPDAVERAAKNS